MPSTTSDRDTMLHATTRRLIPPLAIGIIVAFAFVSLFTAALHNPRPNDLNVGVVGAPGLQRGLQQRLDLAAPGAFVLERQESEASARREVLDHDVQGAIIATGPRPKLLVAGAAGPATGEALRSAFGALAAARGQPLAVEDLRPLPQHDSPGLSAFFTIAGTTVSSLLFGIALFVSARRVPTMARLAAVATFAGLVGVTVALAVDPLVGAMSGAFWSIAGLAALLALAVALPVAALSRLIGPPGIGLAALVLLLVALPSTGGPIGYQFLPDFYTTISQALPSGSALTAVRNAVYFGGANTLAPILVLIAWALSGLLGEIVAAGVHRARSTRSRTRVARATPVAS